MHTTLRAFFRNEKCNNGEVGESLNQWKYLASYKGLNKMPALHRRSRGYDITTLPKSYAKFANGSQGSMIMTVVGAQETHSWPCCIVIRHCFAGVCADCDGSYVSLSVRLRG